MIGARAISRLVQPLKVANNTTRNIVISAPAKYKLTVVVSMIELSGVGYMHC